MEGEGLEDHDEAKGPEEEPEPTIAELQAEINRLRIDLAWTKRERWVWRNGFAFVLLGPPVRLAFRNWILKRKETGEPVPTEETVDLASAIVSRFVRTGLIVGLAGVLLSQAIQIWGNWEARLTRREMVRQSVVLANQARAASERTFAELSAPFGVLAEAVWWGRWPEAHAQLSIIQNTESLPETLKHGASVLQADVSAEQQEGGNRLSVTRRAFSFVDAAQQSFIAIYGRRFDARRLNERAESIRLTRNRLCAEAAFLRDAVVRSSGGSPVVELGFHLELLERFASRVEGASLALNGVAIDLKAEGVYSRAERRLQSVHEAIIWRVREGESIELNSRRFSDWLVFEESLGGLGITCGLPQYEKSP